MLYNEEYVKKGGPLYLVWLAGTLKVSDRFDKENSTTIEKLITRSFDRESIFKVDVPTVTDQIIKAINYAFPYEIPRSVNEPPRFSFYFSSVLFSGTCIIQRFKSAMILDDLTLCCESKLDPKAKKRVLEWDDTNANWKDNVDLVNSQELDESIQTMMDRFKRLEDNDNLDFSHHTAPSSQIDASEDNLLLRISNKDDEGFGPGDDPNLSLFIMEHGIHEVLNFNKSLLPMSEPYQGRHPHVNVLAHPDVGVPEHPDGGVLEHTQEGDSVPASKESLILEQPDLAQDSAPMGLEERPQDVEQDDMVLEPLEEQPSIQRGQRKRKCRLWIDESTQITKQEMSRQTKKTFFATCQIEDAQIPPYLNFITQAPELLRRPGMLPMGSKLQSLFKERFQMKENLIASEISQIKIVRDHAIDSFDQIHEANVSEHPTVIRSRSESYLSTRGREYNETVQHLEDAINEVLPRGDQETKGNTTEEQLTVGLQLQPLELPVPQDMPQAEVAVIEQPSEEIMPEAVAAATQGDSGPLPPPQLDSVDLLPSIKEPRKRTSKDKDINKARKPRTKMSDVELETPPIAQLTHTEEVPQLDPMVDATQLDKDKQVCEPEPQQSPHPCEGFSDSHSKTPREIWEESDIESMVLDMLQMSTTGTINILDIFQGKQVIRQQAAYAFSVLLSMHNRNIIILHQDGSGPITITLHG